MATEKKTTGAAAEAFDTLTNMNPEAFKEGYEKFANGMSEAADFQKSSLEALMASAGTLTKGVEKAASEQTAFVKASYEDGVAAAKAAATSNSIQEALDIQTDYVRKSFEKNLGQFNKMADHWIATTKEASEPLTARYSELVEKVQSYRP